MPYIVYRAEVKTLACEVEVSVALVTLTASNAYGHYEFLQASSGQAAAAWQQTKATAMSTQRSAQSITTVSALPSMDETVASSLQQQALVSSLKRKREGEDDDDYDA